VARRLFPGAPEPFVDLSTGINPHPYPIPVLLPHIFAQLPQAGALADLRACACTAYGAPSQSNVVPAAGMQSLVTQIAGAAPQGRTCIVGPTYAEHARALHIAGRDVEMVDGLAPLGEAALGVVVNPNNPDGRVFAREELLAIAERQRRHGGMLVIDEAFMDVAPRENSLAADVEAANLVVLRSFGKAYGLAGLRLSFALAAPDFAARLRASLGPWPLSGPAAVVGARALSDKPWLEETRATLAHAATRLDGILEAAGFTPAGGTPLFRFVQHGDAPDVFERLGRAGLFVRRFAEEPKWLRFGLPATEDEWQRLKAALSGPEVRSRSG